MGVTVREKPPGSGVWWVFVHHHGRRQSRRIGRDEKLAQEAARKIQARLTLQGLGFKASIKPKTFGEYAKRWQETVLPAASKPSTVRDYQGLLKRHILPVFGPLPVTEITRLRVKEFLAAKAKQVRKIRGPMVKKADGEGAAPLRVVRGYSPSTIQHMKNVISMVLGMAIDDEVLQVNPAQRLGKVIRHKSMKLEADPLTRQELSGLLETFRVEFPAHYALALTLARTGMRIGEALSLQWGDLDFHGRFIVVRRGISRGKIETPKNGKARRVDMSRQLAAALQQFRVRRREFMLRTVYEPDEGLFRARKYKGEPVRGWEEFPDWVFITDQGHPMDASSWRQRVYEKALEKAKLRKIRIHDLRHTYASLLIQAGESLAYVRDQLGHHSIKVTVDIYGHLAPEGNKAAVDRLDDSPSLHPSAPYTHPETSKGLAKIANPLILLAGPMGFEPTPSDVTGRRYNQA